MLTIIILAFAGTIIGAGVGTLWYSNATPMGKIHMRYLGFDKLTKEEQIKKIEEAKPKMFKMYASQMVLSFLTSFFVVFVVTQSVKNGVPLAMAIGFPVLSWLCFVVPTVGSGILWGNCEQSIVWKKFFSDIFSNLVTILLTAFITSLFV